MQNANDGKVLEVSARENEQRVKRYYDYTRIFYRLFWHGGTDSLHYGFYDGAVENHKESLLRNIEVTATHACIKEDSVVADLGCGVGGVAFWIARNLNATVHGITLSESQYEKALQLRKKYCLENRTHFVLGNYLKSPFQNNQFDAVVSIEALCHGQHVIDELARELFRITKIGGTLAVMDGFLGIRELTSKEKQNVEIFERGLAIVKMVTPEIFMTALINAGFRDVDFTDYTTNVLPASKKLHSLTRQWFFVTKLLANLKIIPHFMLQNSLAGQVQWELCSRRALVYGCITAKK